MARMMKTLAVSAAGFIFAGAAAAGSTALAHPVGDPAVPAPAAPSFQAPPTLPIAPDTISDVVKRAGPAVVNIISARAHGSVSYGSGFIVNSGGDVITNDDIVAHSHRIEVYVGGYGKPFTAKEVEANYAGNVAVLKISAPRPLPTVPLGSSAQTPVGAWAIAIGNRPNSSQTVMLGVVSATHRSITVGSRHYANLLQTSAPINHGDGGGPLLNLKGQVIGLNTVSSQEGQGIGFAIPVSTIKNVFSNVS